VGSQAVSASLRIAVPDYEALRSHLFRSDRDEHAALALAGWAQRGSDVELYVRELHLLSENEFVPGTHGYKQIAAGALARIGNRAADERLALVSCHSHPGATTRNALSRDDLAGHRRVFPHLLDIVGGPVAGLAFGTASVAGEVWLPGARSLELDHMQVVGGGRLVAHPGTQSQVDDRFDRQVRLFGAEGQRVLRGTQVAVIGLGGGGSMLVEQLAHLGTGSILGIDFDHVKRHNLSRIVGAEEADARRGAKKTEVAQRLVARIDPDIDFEPIDGDIADRSVAERVSECDFAFLATDTITSRLVANAIAQTYFVPMIQIGAKVDLRPENSIESVYVAVRPVLPRRGCLNCAGLVDPIALRQEANSAEERTAQNYLGTPEVIDPSVVTLNGIAASTAATVFLMSTVGLGEAELWQHRLFDARTGSWLTLRTTSKPTCRWCGSSSASNFARGDTATLPVRLGTTHDARRPRSSAPTPPLRQRYPLRRDA